MHRNIPAPTDDVEQRIGDKFINSKPIRILAALQDDKTENYGQEISYAINSTYSHTLKTLKEFQELGIVKYQIKGRKKIYKLTEFGEELAEDCQPWFDRLDCKPENNRGTVLGTSA